uniref:Peptidyl-prolyl cis-trans isomerase n=1 Tax=Setaria digitata TaxID=48799 RepID=A0A915PUS3_9BILA
MRQPKRQGYTESYFAQLWPEPHTTTVTNTKTNVPGPGRGSKHKRLVFCGAAYRVLLNPQLDAVQFDCMSVTLQTTLGDIKLELYCDLCPKTCENFLALCASGYYDNCIFHRNIKDFMVQTGDPTGTGKGGDSIWGGPIEDELNAALKNPIEFNFEAVEIIFLQHDARGVVSMAGNGPNTGRSQFFITYAKHPTLDLKYTIFGRVIDGFDVLDELEKVKVDAKYRPVIEQKIRNVIIHANPIADMATNS